MLKYLTANMDPTSQPFGAVLAATALGWQIFRAPDGAGIVFHTGGTGGYRTFHRIRSDEAHGRRDTHQFRDRRQ